MFYRFARMLMKIFFYTVYRPKVYGKENIPKTGRMVIVSNHRHFFDCLCVGTVNKRTLHFLAKDELINGKFGFIFKMLQIIPVNRRQKDHNALESAVNCLNKDEAVAIFPEGTFNKTGNILAPFKMGAVKMAHDTKSPIVPMALVSPYKLSFKRFIVRVGEPYIIKSDNLEKENEKLMKTIEKLLREGE